MYEQRHSSWMQPLFPSHDICLGASEEDPEDTVVLLTGGQANNRRLSSIETFPTVPSCTLPPLPRARAGHSTFVTTGPKQNVVVCGGFDGEYTSSCLVLDVENQRWDSNKIGQLPQARMSHSAVSINTVGTYLIGGTQNNNKRTIDFLPERTTEWTTGPSMDMDMDEPCAVKITKLSFLVFHKKNIREYMVDVANPTSSSGWQPTKKWPLLQISRTNNPGCSKIGSKVVVAGGRSGSTYPESAEVLDLTYRIIASAGNMNSPRVFFHVATITQGGQESLFAFGGHSGTSHLDSVEQFDPRNSNWALAPIRMEEKKNAFGAGVVTKRLICPKTIQDTVVLITGGVRDQSQMQEKVGRMLIC